MEFKSMKNAKDSVGKKVMAKSSALHVVIDSKCCIIKKADIIEIRRFKDNSYLPANDMQTVFSKKH